MGHDEIVVVVIGAQEGQLALVIINCMVNLLTPDF